MRNTNDPIDPQVERLLASLEKVPERDGEVAARGRQAYLAQVSQIRAARKSAVTVPADQRHIGWLNKIFRKDMPKMSALTTLILIVTLIFGGSGAAYAAAQDTLPGQSLYALKAAGEDLQLRLSASEQNRLELALQFSQRRVEEMARLNAAGEEIPALVQARWQQQVEEALRLCGGFQDEPQRLQALEQVRARLQAQQQILGEILPKPPATAGLLRALEMVQLRLREVEQARNQPGAGGGPGQPAGQGGQPTNAGTPRGTGAPIQQGGNPWISGTPTPGSSYGPGPGVCTTNCTPQATPQGGNNPYTTGTPTPGSGYGPGSGTCTTNCTPQATPQGTPQGGSNPYTTGTPTPGSGYGPGSGTCTTNCTPQATPQGTPQGGGRP